VVAVVNRAILNSQGMMGRVNPALRMVGKSRLRAFEITIGQASVFRQGNDGRRHPAIVPPFLPESLTEPFHPGGNSLCYAIQLAHRMGSHPIIAVGFTLRSGTGYEHGQTNPATRKPNSYPQHQIDRVMDWCSWYEETFPGKVQLDPGFSGPIYEVFSKASFDG
jgi:hypothetical protein